MKKKLSLLMVALVAVAAFAVQIGKRAAQEVTYALAEGDTFTSGQTVDVKNGDDVVATITYGEAGGADFAAAAASNSIEGFTAYTAGNGTNGNKAGGTWYTITPVYAGSISVAVKLGADKVFHIAEDGVDLAAYNGITVAETYYGTYTFDVKAGSSYKVYCDGSKLGFFGFKYSYEVGEEPTPEPQTGDPVVLDFTVNDWGFPSDAKAVDEAEFTQNGYTIKVAGTAGNGYRWYANNGNPYFLFGKQGAYITLPAFDFDVTKIEIVGTSGASTGVVQNIFVGENAVSTETTGAKDVTNVYEIAEPYQAAGNIYTIKVTSNHNTQLQKILVYPKAVVPANTFSAKVAAALAAPVDGVATLTLDADYEADAAVNVPLGTQLVIDGAGHVLTLGEATNFVLNDNITLKNVKIDATALTAPLIALTATPAEGTKKNQDVYTDAAATDFNLLNAVTVENVMVKNLKAEFISNSGIEWALENFTLSKSIIQLDATGKNFIAFHSATGNKSAIKNITISENTIYNINETSNAYFIRFANASNAAKAFGTNNGTSTFDYKLTKNTIVNTFKAQNFGNNTPNNGKVTIEATQNIFADVKYVSKFVQNNCTKTVEKNVAWGEGAEASISDIVETPVFTVPTAALDLTAENGGIDLKIDASSKAAEYQAGDPRWVVEFVDPNLLWSSETAVPCNWAGEIVIAAEKLADVKVGDKIHVAVEGVTPAGEWDAMVTIRDGKDKDKDLEQGIAVGLGDKDDVAFTVTGDIKRFIQANGLVITGGGFSSKKVWLEPAAEALGSDNSIWVGSHNVQLVLSVAHFLNANDKTGVAAGDKLVVTCTATDPAPENVWFVLSDGNWHDVEGAAFTDIEGGKEYTFTAEVAELAKSGGLIINQNGYTITQVELVPAPKPEDIEIAAADIVEGDITAAIAAASEGKIVKNITINLAAETAYKVTAPIVAPASVTINGNGATIDASALDAPFIQMSETPGVEATVVGEAEAALNVYNIDGVTIKDVKITGVKKQLFYANKMQYLLQKLSVDNCVIALEGTKTIFDFNSGGNVVELSVNKSTIYGPEEGWANGGFHSTQSSKSVQQLGGESEKTIITNSTLYNIAKGKTTSTIVKNSQTWMSYEVKNNVIVNCGKSGQFVAGLNAGQPGKTGSWTVDGNIFNFDGADVGETENSKIADEMTNTIAGIITFNSVETPDFGGSLAYTGEAAPTVQPGDPRWTITYTQAPQKFTITVAEATNGVVAVEPTTAAAGETVTITATPAEGYEVDEVKVECTIINEAVIVTEGEIPGTYTYTQPADDVVVTVTFKQPTGINSISVAAAKYGEGDWYTINGTRIEMPTQKGLYIHNGKKVVVK